MRRNMRAFSILWEETHRMRFKHYKSTGSVVFLKMKTRTGKGNFARLVCRFKNFESNSRRQKGFDLLTMAA